MGETPRAISSMAAQTTGLALREDDWAGLQHVLRDQQSYYLLGYEPAGSQQDEAPSVKVTRSGLAARSRSSLPGIVPTESYTDYALPRSELRSLMSMDPLDASELPVRISTLFQHSGSNWLVVALTVDAHHVAMTHRLSGSYEGGLEIELRVLDEKGGLVADQNASQNLNLKEAAYRQMLDEGLNYAIRVQIPRPGVLQVIAGIRDATSGRTGIGRRLAEVPDLSNGALVLSGIVLEPTAEKPGQNASGTVRRVFRPGEQLAYGCTIYDISVDAQNRAELVMTSRMYRGSKLVFQGKPAVLTPNEAVTSKMLTLRGTVNLGAETAAGDLIFQLIVEDRHAQGDRRTASQWTEFRVR
jgi:hypothetical protein